MPGMSGDVDEQPARRSAGMLLVLALERCGMLDLHSRMMAIAIRSMRRWW